MARDSFRSSIWASADHIEVLRGPFSAIYGNSSGGVIAVFTKDAPPGFDLGSTIEYGSLNTQHYAALAEGDTGLVNYVVDVSHFQTDGYRRHSEAQRNQLNSKVRLKLDDVSQLTFIANAVVSPFMQDPLGLTAAQVAANPEQAGTGADMFNTRKSLAQEQLGLSYDREFGDHDSLVAWSTAAIVRPPSTKPFRSPRRRCRPVPAASSIWRATTTAPTCISPIIANSWARR